jgi:protein-S-isoprenylcysteine O-methyltransferase Ste14
MIDRLRILLGFQGATYLIASLIHAGVAIDNNEHREAAIAEGLIAAVLFAGLLVTLARPELTRDAALGAQGFALALTCVGIFTIAIGVGPRTVPDVVYHIGIVAILIWGLRAAWQMPENRLPQGG